MDHSPERNGLEIAIIGMSGRFPDAKNVDEYWHNLRNGLESIRTFSADELKAAGVDPDQPNYVRAGSVIENIDLFDAAFFGYNPKEAATIDPQHRIFLELTWEALESAGYVPEMFPGLIGVYGGVGLSNYLLNLYSHPDLSHFLVMIGNDKDFLTTRISYKLNLKGPSVNVQSACSTSLVAVHLACQGLLSGECDIALAGGVAVKVPQKSGYLFEEGSILSPDGHCRAFDAEAKGTVIGNGAGIVVLKRLEDALNDGDTIHAIIKGTAINNDGSLKVGYTAPSIDGQAAVIRAAQMMAEVDPETITYVETHGTGTALGDPIEIAALNQVWHSQQKRQCAIGSVKPNIGHLDTAAGVAGLIKAVQALKHAELPPSINFERPNPTIDFDHSVFYVNTHLTPWNTEQLPRRAAISSFGIGGTNAHAVLEEAPVDETDRPSRPWQVLLWSARTPDALDAATQNLTDFLKAHPVDLADAAYTLQVGRRAFGYRRMLVCQSVEDAIAALESRDQQRVVSSSQEVGDPSVVFMFPGQGAQYVNMGLDLYQSESVFRDQIDQCAAILQSHLGCDIRDLLFGRVADAEDQLTQTAITQPVLFTIEYALAKLWMEWGVMPQAMVGHSIGEYVAACLAGVFSLEDALALVAARGRFMQGMPSGAMLSVPLPEAEIRPLLSANLSLAAINTPSMCVVAGPQMDIEQFASQLSDQGIETRPLHTSHAFHSHMMDAMLQPFEAQVRRITLNSPQIPYVSNVTGTWITADEATDPHYWAQHVRQTVRFYDNLNELLAQPGRLLLEVGPGRTLTTFAKQHPAKPSALTSLRHPKETVTDTAFLLSTLGKLWLAGGAICWSQFYREGRRCRIPLPTYPFERQRYWIERQDLHYRTPWNQKQAIEHWFYMPAWEQRSLSVGPIASQSWAVLPGFGTQVVDLLRANGQSVVCVNTLTELPDRVVVSSLEDLLCLVQNLKDQPTQIDVITSSVFTITGTEPINPSQAALLGLCKVIPLEYPQITCRLIDLDTLPTVEWQRDRLVKHFIASPETTIAYRNGACWVPTYQPISLPESISWRENGVYLLTGTLNEIGTALMECLRQNGATTIQTDVNAVNQIEQQYGALHGVVYTPSLSERFCALDDLDPAVMAQQLGSVAAELETLAQALAGKQLDFCLVHSSLASILGGAGLALQANVDALIDAFVAQQNHTSVFPWISINWDVWQTGLSFSEAGITPDEGQQVLNRILGSGITGQVIVSTTGLEGRLQQLQAKPAESEPLHERPQLQTSYLAPRNELEEAIAVIWQDLLGISQVGIYDNFFELGGHSLLGTQLMARLRDIFPVSLSLNRLFTAQTVADLAVALVQELAAQQDNVEGLLAEI